MEQVRIGKALLLKDRLPKYPDGTVYEEDDRRSSVRYQK
jgi:hypothetical protein